MNEDFKDEKLNEIADYLRNAPLKDNQAIMCIISEGENNSVGFQIKNSVVNRMNVTLLQRDQLIRTMLELTSNLIPTPDIQKREKR